MLKYPAGILAAIACSKILEAAWPEAPIGAFVLLGVALALVVRWACTDEDGAEL